MHQLVQDESVTKNYILFISLSLRIQTVLKLVNRTCLDKVIQDLSHPNRTIQKGNYSIYLTT